MGKAKRLRKERMKRRSGALWLEVQKSQKEKFENLMIEILKCSGRTFAEKLKHYLFKQAIQDAIHWTHRNVPPKGLEKWIKEKSK